jgi:hypothetical protein
MQTKLIILKRHDGGLELSYPTNDDYIENIVQDYEDRNLFTEIKVIHRSDLDPNIYEFQEAFNFTNGNFEFVPERMKKIWYDKFRAARKPILEKLDVEYIKALEAGDIQKQQDIAAKKQQLRDITTLPLPDDLQGIKNTWPVILNS